MADTFAGTGTIYANARRTRGRQRALAHQQSEAEDLKESAEIHNVGILRAALVTVKTIRVSLSMLNIELTSPAPETFRKS